MSRDNRPLPRGSVLPVLIVVAVCLTMGGISVLETRHMSIAHGTSFEWVPVVRGVMPRWLYLAATLPLALVVAQRVPLVPPRLTSMGTHVVLLLAISLGEAFIAAWMMGLANPLLALAFPWEARWTRAWYNALPLMLALYGAVALAAWGMEEARERQRRTLRAAHLETQLQSARLATLRAQLQPHFLYNTLNGIAALVADVQPARAVAAIEQLAELLQASLRDDARQQVTIEEEVGLARRYLSLQRMRFGDRLSFTSVVDDTVADALVPVLLLQPIVENAVVHGIEGGAPCVHVTVAAETTGAGIELRVENTGTRRGESAPGGHGVGLAATRARLESAYGSRATLHFEPRATGGAVVRISIPRLDAPVASVAPLALVS